jgi:hypothetical protein
MNTKDFRTASDLVDYVNDQGILKADVVCVRVLDHRWWLFWYP